LPFTWQTELLEPSAITGCVGFSKALDRRFGKQTTGAKMTDVPGHTRGLIAPLAASGVTLLDIGVNSASTPPDVPEAFVWKDAAGASIIMLYHRMSYGGVIQFPGAAVQAASLTEIANAVEPFRKELPVLTQEIGDTWIYGVASDPVKLGRIRELVRLREEWIGRKKLNAADEVDLAFLKKFALAVEHTWGTDTKTWLDFEHYTPDALASMLDDAKYKTVSGSWQEKRDDIDAAVAALPETLRDEALKRLAGLAPVGPPNRSDLKEHAGGGLFETTHFSVALDPASGAITELRHKGRRWASAQHPLALFSYQTLAKADYDKFLASYITVRTDWAPKDFGKPNIEKFGAESKIWTAKLAECWAGELGLGHRMAARLQFGERNSPVTAWPEDCYLDLLFPKDEPSFEVHIKWFRKRANRLPEALWLTFNPAVFEAQRWTMAKTGQTVSPFDVVSGGNRQMHVVSGIEYRDGRGGLEIEPLDAGLVALGEMTPLGFSKRQTDVARGLHFCLFNNGWGTNYVQWFGGPVSEDMRFRFQVRVSG
jgi:hypothetical protein